MTWPMEGLRSYDKWYSMGNDCTLSQTLNPDISDYNLHFQAMQPKECINVIYHSLRKLSSYTCVSNGSLKSIEARIWK